MEIFKQKKTYILLGLIAVLQAAAMFAGLDEEAVNQIRGLQGLLATGVVATLKAGFNRLENGR